MVTVITTGTIIKKSQSLIFVAEVVRLWLFRMAIGEESTRLTPLFSVIQRDPPSSTSAIETAYTMYHTMEKLPVLGLYATMWCPLFEAH